MLGVQINGSLQSLFGLVVHSGCLEYHPQQMIDLGIRSVLPKLLFADFDRLWMPRCTGKRRDPAGQFVEQRFPRLRSWKRRATCGRIIAGWVKAHSVRQSR